MILGKPFSQSQRLCKRSFRDKCYNPSFRENLRRPYGLTIVLKRGCLAPLITLKRPSSKGPTHFGTPE